MTVKIYQNLRKVARNLFWLRKSVQESRDLGCEFERSTFHWRDKKTSKKF